MSKQDWTVVIVLGVALLLTGGIAVTGYSPTIRRIARAIAIAERGQAEIDSGQIVNNNPGDIEHNGQLIRYPTLDDGWNALYHQVALMFGGSAHYSPDMTISEIAQKYVGTPDWVNWASNVAAVLGVSPETPLGQV